MHDQIRNAQLNLRLQAVLPMQETRILRISVVLTTAFAVVGVVLGLLVRSNTILLDGVFSTLGVILSGVSLAVARTVAQDDADGRFPFGTSQLEPIFVFCKTLAVIGMCVYAIADAVRALLSGGTEVILGPAIGYGIISSLVCIAWLWFLNVALRKAETPLLRAEYHQWMGDTILSGGVLIGFGLSLFLSRTSFAWVTVYIDPIMVLVCGVSFIVMPVRSLLNSASDILGLRPSEEVMTRFEDASEQIGLELAAEYKLHLVKVGRRLDVELNLYVPERSFTTEQMDAIRSRLAGIADSIGERHWISVNFTGKRSEL